MTDFAAEIVAARAEFADVLIDTGALTRNPYADPAETQIWTGPCLVTPVTSRDEPVAPHDRAAGVLYRALLPASAPEPVRDDLLTLSACLDSTLIDAPLRVRVSKSSGALVFRELIVERMPTP